MLRHGFLTCLLVAALATPAVARSLVIERFDVHIEVGPDASIVVKETLRPRFTGSWNGIVREIPVEYRTPQGFGKRLVVELLSVTDGEGTPLKVESSRVRHYRRFRVWVPNAQDATRTVLLTYRVPNALLFLEEHDELYWNVAGDEWEIPIEAASAVVALPGGVTGVRAVAFTGPYGSRERDADVAIAGRLVTFRMRRPLAFREGMTAVAGWDKGFVREPGPAAKVAGFLRSNWPLGVPVVFFAGMFWLWHTRGRDPRRRPVAVQYEPPAELTPAEVGTLIDNRPDMRDVTATLVDLAVRGFLVIEETTEERLLGLWSSTDYRFRLRKPREQWTPLKPHERHLLAALFTGREAVDTSELENAFYADLPKIRDRIYEALLQRRYYDHRPDKVQRAYLIGGGALAAASVFGAGALSETLGVAPLAWSVAGLLSAASVLGFGRVMPARTVRGTRVLEAVLGFEEFLRRVEGDRFERMPRTPAIFEKYLPFAMALGVEKRWVGAFGDIYRQPPEWYRGSAGGGPFRSSRLVDQMGRMSTRTAAAMASAPRSSGGSGFGGGGSSGGGGGGGGGGGF